MIEPLQITAPVLPGVMLEDVKTHLRITHDDEDNLLDAYVAAATRHFEWQTGRTIYETEWEIAMDGFPAYAFCLPRAHPLTSVTHIKYKDSAGADTTLSTSLYVVDTHGGRIAPAYGESWPSFTPYPLSAVRIRYKAGIPLSSPQVYVEDGIRQCIVEMVGAMYENREFIMPTDRATVAAFAENPMTRALLNHYRVAYAF